MSKKIKLKIITPEKIAFEELVDQVSLPTTKGEITILPTHIPLISGLASGDIVACIQNECIPFAVVGGFVEVKSVDTNLEALPPLGGKASKLTEVAILADFAEHVSELTDEKIEEARAKAEELKKQLENKEHIDFEHFEAELERSLTRVKIADKWRSKKYRR
jgi:F-type H+-transporting ATPase subunit epsilon